MKQRIKVVKIGGNVVDDPQALAQFLHDFASLAGPKVLVHGGGKVATTVASRLGIEAQMVDGRRVTDAQTLRIVTMVYAGLINKQLVVELQALGCNALGLCGADGGLVTARKRAVTPAGVDYGFVGDPVALRATTALALLHGGLTPIIAPITGDGAGGLLNTNADTMAQYVAVGLAQTGEYAVELVYCFEKQGVLRDVTDESSVIPRIDRALYEVLKGEGVVSAGMLPKLDNAFSAIAGGVDHVVICAAKNLTLSGYGGTILQL